MSKQCANASQNLSDMENLKRLIAKYAVPGPRYTSYPTALDFSKDADKGNLKRLALSELPDASLYVHIPFCANLCRFCGCTTTLGRDLKAAEDYLTLVEKELENWRRAGMPRRLLRQIHLGGGTPNFLSPEQIMRLGAIISEYFEIADGCEFSAELDPRTLARAKVQAFAKIGVNRASLGVQDTNPEVQKAVNRIQPPQRNKEAVSWLRESGINNINIDLMYGLPLQTIKSFEKTIEDALELDPARIALFGYAHVPWVKPAQKVLEKCGIPTSEEKADLFILGKRSFEEAGYEFIGLDHFAKPADALIKARKNGTLHRNFQGYSTCAGIDLFAVGLTSISETRTSYRQNFKTMEDYKKAVESGELPIERGIVLDGEDLLRRAVIMDIMCALKVDFNNYGVDFRSKFAEALAKMEDMQKDGLVEMHEGGFSVLPIGRLFLRNIAMLFDGRLSAHKNTFSKTV